MKNSEIVGRIATKRIEILLDLAEKRTVERTPESKRLARRYTDLARRIREHYKVPAGEVVKRSVCKKCGNFLIPGINCSVRMASSKGYMVYVCECGEEKHIFYKKRR
jgi:ribonuclease P protein subunit RPR2